VQVATARAFCAVEAHHGRRGLSISVLAAEKDVADFLESVASFHAAQTATYTGSGGGSGGGGGGGSSAGSGPQQAAYKYNAAAAYNDANARRALRVRVEPPSRQPNAFCELLLRTPFNQASKQGSDVGFSDDLGEEDVAVLSADVVVVLPGKAAAQRHCDLAMRCDALPATTRSAACRA